MAQSEAPFNIIETTIEDVHAAYKSGGLTCRKLVQMYLDRIEAFDKQGPGINAIITINSQALAEADRLDAAYKASGPVGPLHGIPVIFKDQGDVKGMPTTLGSLLFKDYYPDRDSFVAEKLKKAGAVILAKATLGELGGGDTHGSLFGSTRNPYDTERTVGGSSGGSAAAVSANYSTPGVGQEGLASIRRPSTWNCISGMRPMARTVGDLAALLDIMVGYDPEDPITARGIGHIPETYKTFLDKNGLKGARIGILRESIGLGSEPESEDFKKIGEVFDKAVADLKANGAEIIDPITIPKLSELMAKRSSGPGDSDKSFQNYYGRSANPPFKSREEVIAAPEFAKVVRRSQDRFKKNPDAMSHYEHLKAQDELMTNYLKVMADHRLNAIVHRAPADFYPRRRKPTVRGSERRAASEYVS